MFRRAVVPCLVLSILTCLALANVASAEPIVFSSNDNTGNAMVWKMNEIGSGVEVVESRNGGAWGGDLSPDGQQVIYTTNRTHAPAQQEWGLYIVDINGANRRQLVSEVQSPTGSKPGSGTWGPDGNTIYFSWPELNAGTDIWRINKDGSGLSRVLDAPVNVHYTVTDVSVDGTLLAYARGVSGSPDTLHILNLTTGASTSFSPAATSGSFSPNGTRIAFSTKLSTDPGYRIYTSSVDWTDLRRVTSGTSGDAYPAWSPDGSTITYDKVGIALHSVGVDGSNDRKLISYPVGGVFLDPSYRQFSTTVPFVDFEALLPQYVPRMRYELQELYFADSAATITDNWLSPKKKSDYRTNKLNDDFGTTIAASDPAHPSATLSLDFLGTYSDRGTDRLDEANTYQEDAARMHGLDLYANRIYARSKKDAGDGRWWLQYWFWFYYNNQSAPIFGGVHEGDWEMIQIGLDPTGQPELVTYAQHKDENAEHCRWVDVSKAFSPQGLWAPEVFVANASHASYGWGGQSGGPIEPTDQHRGDGPAVWPRVSVVASQSPGWMTYSGAWGGSDTRVNGPAFQGTKWNSPSTFHRDAGDCGIPDASPSSVRTGTVRRSGHPMAPSRPIVRARAIKGRRVSVSYRVPAGVGKRRAVRLLLTVHSSRSGVSPRGASYRLPSTGRGRRVLDLPFGPGPYVVRASAYNRRGSGSPRGSAAVR
jgi:hypothetical protein